jgi:hypothetical protein
LNIPNYRQTLLWRTGSADFKKFRLPFHTTYMMLKYSEEGCKSSSIL